MNLDRGLFAVGNDFPRTDSIMFPDTQQSLQQFSLWNLVSVVNLACFSNSNADLEDMT